MDKRLEFGLGKREQRVPHNWDRHLCDLEDRTGILPAPRTRAYANKRRRRR